MLETKYKKKFANYLKSLPTDELVNNIHYNINFLNTTEREEWLITLAVACTDESVRENFFKNCLVLGSDNINACVVKKSLFKQKYVLFLNSNLWGRNLSAENRVWIMLHEIGHVYHNHSSDFWTDTLSEKEYEQMEGEADAFANDIVKRICIEN